MQEAGHVRGDVFTHNFDGLLERCGVRTQNVRSYAQIVPDIALATDAKALLVVGLHADRRRIQAAARRAGLKVIHIDPQQLPVAAGWRDYPLEISAPDDAHIVLPAGEALPRSATALLP